jgi:hypothetical protein
MAYTFYEPSYRDMYRDVYGVRPSRYDPFYTATTDDEKQAIWDRLCIDLDYELAREKEAEKRAIADWRKRIQEIKDLGAKDEATAIRWDMQALEVEKDMFDNVGYYCYLREIPYSFEVEIKEKLNL